MWVTFRKYQEIQYSPISTITTILLIFVALVPTVFLFRMLIRSGLNAVVFAFMIMCLASTFIYGGNGDISLIKQIIYIMFWESILFLFYFLSYYNEHIFSESLLMYMLLFIPLTLMFIISNIIRGKSYLYYEDANNNIFYLLTLLPWFMMSRNSKLRLIFILFILTMSVYSLKRSAIIVSVLCSIFYVYHVYLKNGQRVRSIAIGAILVLVAILLISYANKISNGTAFERIQSIEEDNGSGRVNRYINVWELIRKEKSVDKILLGRGLRAVEVQMGTSRSAHNDFLEVLFDYGVIGLILYVMMHIALIRRIRFLSRIKSPVYEGYFMSYVIFFIMSMVSHLVIYPTYFIFLTSYWGAVEGGLVKRI